MDELITTLIDAGFSEKEAQIYIALLAHGTAAVSEIADRTGINRSTVQVALSTLLEKGIIAESAVKGRVHVYTASSPEVVLEVAEKRVERESTTRERLALMLPALREINKGANAKPTVRVMGQREGLLMYFSACIKTREKCFRVISSMLSFFQLASKEEYIAVMKERMRRGIQFRSIYPLNDITEQMLGDRYGIDEQVYIPEKNYDFKSDIGLADDIIAYMSVKVDGEGILIESKEMADSMKSLYDLAMIGAKNIPGAVYLPSEK